MGHLRNGAILKYDFSSFFKCNWTLPWYNLTTQTTCKAKQYFYDNPQFLIKIG